MTSSDLVRIIDGRAQDADDSRVVAPANVYRELRVLVSRGEIFARRLDPDRDAIPLNLTSVAERVWLYSLTDPVPRYTELRRNAIAETWPKPRPLPTSNPAYPNLSRKTPEPEPEPEPEPVAADPEGLGGFLNDLRVQAIHQGIQEMHQEILDLRAFKARIEAAVATDA